MPIGTSYEGLRLAYWNRCRHSGLNLFVLAGITGEPVIAIAKRAGPFVLAMLLVVLILAFVPVLSIWAL